MPRRAVLTIIYCLSLGLVTIASARISQGQHFTKVLPFAFAVMTAGLTASLSLWWKGKRADQECDEREKLINAVSMKNAFYAMSLIITALWSYEAAETGTFLNSITIVFYAQWLCFLAAYIINKFRY